MSIDQIIKTLLENERCSHFDVMVGQRLKNPLVGVFLSKAFREGHMAAICENGIINPDPTTIFSSDDETVLDEETAEAIRREIINYGFSDLLHGTFLALPKPYSIDQGLRCEIERLSKASPALCSKNSVHDDMVNEQQQKAIVGALHHTICLITGGPGTGKTFTAGRYLSAIARSSSSPIRVAALAPTGRAVQALSGSLQKALDQEIHISAKTIHAAVVSSDTFLPYHVIIIDESSMIDSFLMHQLLKRIHSGTRVVMLGDPDQLPSIDPGQPFFDFLRLPFIPSFHLSECVRTDSKEILHAARAIREGNVDLFFSSLERDGVVRFIFCENESDWNSAQEYIDQTCLRPWQKISSVREAQELQRKVVLLSPKKNGLLGVSGLNARGKQLRLRFTPVVCTKNMHQIGVMNGDLGVYQHGADELIHFQQRAIPSVLCPRSDAAFALTVHKSQGSEFGQVVLVLPHGVSVDRRLLYTALTRAKNSVVIIGNKSDLRQAIEQRRDRVSILREEIAYDKNTSDYRL